MVDAEKTAKAATSLVGTAAILRINLKTVETINQVMQKTTKSGRKPYRTTRRFPTALKTTTPEGKREYQRWYMRERNNSPPDKWLKHKPLSGAPPDPFGFRKNKKRW